MAVRLDRARRERRNATRPAAPYTRRGRAGVRGKATAARFARCDRVQTGQRLGQPVEERTWRESLVRAHRAYAYRARGGRTRRRIPAACGRGPGQYLYLRKRRIHV